MPEGNLHQYAVDAEQNLEKLATGLAQAGADKETVSAVGKMADLTRQLVKALGKGQEQTADDEPPVEPEPEPEAEQQPRTMDDATADLHNEVLAKRKRGE